MQEAALGPRTPREPVPSVPPIGEAESSKGVQGDISSWSEAEGREGEAVSLRALEGDSESPPRQGPPLRYGGFRAACIPPNMGCPTNYCLPPNFLLLTYSAVALIFHQDKIKME